MKYEPISSKTLFEDFLNNEGIVDKEQVGFITSRFCSMLDGLLKEFMSGVGATSNDRVRLVVCESYSEVAIVSETLNVEAVVGVSLMINNDLWSEQLASTRYTLNASLYLNNR
tara:strand:+ start:34 stop:372 length:339 start_codon:yes stop_codon:yes gene_type:complete